jgi:nucleoside phosphorylase
LLCENDRLLRIWRGPYHGAAGRFRGSVVSHSRFVSSVNERDWLRSRYKADCVDMESYPLALVCLKSHMPCVVVRVVSDLANQPVGRAKRATLLELSAVLAGGIADLCASL